MPPMKHTHKYLLTKLGGEHIIWENGKKKLIIDKGYPIFKCSLPNCTHFVAKNLGLGRIVLCNVCNQEMEMKIYNLNQKKPHHKECNRG